MFKVVGIETNKVYVVGSMKADCFRELQLTYPTKVESPKRPNTGVKATQIYPEPLKVVRI